MGVISYGKGVTKAMNANNYDEKSLFPPIIAVDFDGTLVQNAFPEIGEVNQLIWDAILAYRAAGWKIILWSCRTGDMLDEAVKFCCARGMIFDSINQNLPEVQQYYGGDTRKVFANMYVDDRMAALICDDTTKTAELKVVPYIDTKR